MKDWADKEAFKIGRITLFSPQKDQLDRIAARLRKLRTKAFMDAADMIGMPLLDGSLSNKIRKEAAERLRWLIKEHEKIRLEFSKKRK